MLQFSIIIIFMLLNQARTEKCLLIDWENLSVQIKFSDCVVHVCYDNCIATSIEQSAAISSFHQTQGSKVQLAIFMSKQPVSQWSPLLQQPTQHREPHCTLFFPKPPNFPKSRNTLPKSQICHCSHCLDIYISSKCSMR
jgi:hypothetical protein